MKSSGTRTRYQRSALWNAAAKLQQDLEVWCGITLQAIDEEQNSDEPSVKHITLLTTRYHYLEQCRELATQLRTRLYNTR